jgi:hypothetical protein
MAKVGCGLAGVFLIYRNFAISSELGWFGILCASFAAAAFYAVHRLAAQPSKFEERLARWREGLPAGWNRLIGYAHVGIWLFAILFVSLWLYAEVEKWLGGNWFSIQWSFLERIHIELAAIAPFAFTLSALLAGAPYLRRAAPRWVFTISRPSPERQELSRRIFGRRPFYSLERVRKFTTIAMPDGKTSEVGERFVFARAFWTSIACVTVLSVAVLSDLAERFMADKPQDLSAVAVYQPVVSTVALDRNGRHLCTFTLENRIHVELKDIPWHVQDAFIVAGDQRFWDH